MTHEPHISEYKRNEVAEVERLFNEYPVIAILNLENLPAANYMQIRHKFKNTAIIKFTKKVFMEKALERIKKPNIQALREHLRGVPALLFTKEDPFTLCKRLEKSKSNAPAKAGQKSPEDILIPAGPTSFTPGPMIGEFGQLGIKTEVKEGKINIKEDKLLIRTGEEIKPKVADLLLKLGIEPMKIGVDLTVAYQDGFIYLKNVLAVSEEEYISNLKLAHTESLNLAMYVSYTTSDTINLQLVKAYYEAKSLAEKSNVPTSETIAREVQEAALAAENVAKMMPEEIPQQEKQDDPLAAVQERKPSDQPTPHQVQEQRPAAHQARSPDIAIENRVPVREDDMKTAEKVLKDIYDRHVRLEPKEATAKKEFQQQETDINKIINTLKDKKSRGEI